jgi:class 3 adenylate cyclase
MLFADICKFTELTTRLPVDKLVKTLNDLFGKFDLAAEVKNLSIKS